MTQIYGEHRKILRRTGWVLVGVGILDTGLMIYCIIHSLNYSSSLNLFALGAGVFLVRGNLEAVRVIVWFSAFMLSGFLLGSVAVFPWLKPLDY